MWTITLGSEAARLVSSGQMRNYQREEVANKSKNVTLATSSARLGWITPPNWTTPSSTQTRIGSSTEVKAKPKISMTCSKMDDIPTGPPPMNQCQCREIHRFCKWITCATAATTNTDTYTRSTPTTLPPHTTTTTVLLMPVALIRLVENTNCVKSPTKHNIWAFLKS